MADDTVHTHMTPERPQQLDHVRLVDGLEPPQPTRRLVRCPRWPVGSQDRAQNRPLGGRWRTRRGVHAFPIHDPLAAANTLVDLVLAQPGVRRLLERDQAVLTALDGGARFYFHG